MQLDIGGAENCDSDESKDETSTAKRLHDKKRDENDSDKKQKTIKFFILHINYQKTIFQFVLFDV